MLEAWIMNQRNSQQTWRVNGRLTGEFDSKEIQKVEKQWMSMSCAYLYSHSSLCTRNVLQACMEFIVDQGRWRGSGMTCRTLLRTSCSPLVQCAPINLSVRPLSQAHTRGVNHRSGVADSRRLNDGQIINRIVFRRDRLVATLQLWPRCNVMSGRGERHPGSRDTSGLQTAHTDGTFSSFWIPIGRGQTGGRVKGWKFIFNMFPFKRGDAINGDLRINLLTLSNNRQCFIYANKWRSRHIQRTFISTEFSSLIECQPNVSNTSLRPLSLFLWPCFTLTSWE